MNKVAGNQRLLRRKGVYYYRRRVPLHLVKEIGRSFIQQSLNTTSLTEAKKRRTLRDLEWDARFDGPKKEAASDSANPQPAASPTQLSEGDLLRLVRDYVERKDEELRKHFVGDPPQSEREKAEMTKDAKLDAQIMRDRDDPQAHQWILDEAIKRAAAEQKALLSPVTQQQYLAALRDVLDLAVKKRLVPVNPAEGLKPVKRDTVAASEKRKPFTLDQIKQFFQCKFYSECAKHPLPFAHDKSGWRFWLPLICLFTGMRPNEAAQMHLNDLKCTPQGTWYLHIVATGDEDDGGRSRSAKTLKTATSRRKIPVHPELIKVGFLQFVQISKKSSSSLRMFPGLKPDKYGNHATYALKRFRDTFLPSAIKMEPRQSFYSFRHSWRDALRRIDAQPATLQALGAWSQGKLTSDDYGDKSDPDYQAKFMNEITFPELDLSSLYHPKK